MRLSSTTVIKKAEHQVSCELDGEVVILDLKASLYFGLNRVGAEVWDALNEPKKAGEICALIHQKFDVDAGRCQEDIFDLLNRLEKVGLIEAINN